jgi:hypothetical protein
MQSGWKKGRNRQVMDNERDGVSVSQVLRAVNTPRDVEELTRMQIARLHTIVQPLFEDLPLAALSASSDQTSAEQVAVDRAYTHYITAEQLLNAALRVYASLRAAGATNPTAGPSGRA